uniref:Dynein regulatory complex subunit 7 n=1 Tax=Trypanosoma congolense (strain IL3000) TaxID=1068625 RepID=G0UMC3_TRYCI|nr:conserved hypothetical protein [Trypanosoma congolense IL3000]
MSASLPPISKGGPRIIGGTSIPPRQVGFSALNRFSFSVATTEVVDESDTKSSVAQAVAPYEAGRMERLMQWVPPEGFPASYTSTTPAEENIFKETMKFQSHFHEYFPRRMPQLLAPMNECLTRKMICTFIRPTALPFDELFDVGSCAEFLAGYMRYEVLEDRERLPDVVVSPSTTLQWQIGNCFELSILLTSLLVGAGYNAYVVIGYARPVVCSNDSTQRNWLDEKGELSTKYRRNWGASVNGRDNAIGGTMNVSCDKGRGPMSTKAPVTNDYCCYIDSDTENDDDPALQDAEYAALTKDRPTLRPANEIDIYSPFYRQQDCEVESTRSMAATKVGAGAESNANWSSTSPLQPNASSYASSCGTNANNHTNSSSGSKPDNDIIPSAPSDRSPNTPAKSPRSIPPSAPGLHSWVLVLPGGRKSLREPVFVEPARGELVAPADAEELYTSVEAIFNGKNYYVNLTPDSAVSALVLDPQDGTQWEPVLFEPNVDDERSIPHNLINTPSGTLASQGHLISTPVSGGPPTRYNSRHLPHSSIATRLRSHEDFTPSNLVGASATLPSGNLTCMLQASRERATHLCCASWVRELTLTRAQYESRYPGGMKFTRYANADVYRYAAYLMPDHRVLEVYMPDTQYANQLQAHVLFEQRADKLRRRSVYPTTSLALNGLSNTALFRDELAAGEDEDTARSAPGSAMRRQGANSTEYGAAGYCGNPDEDGKSVAENVSHKAYTDGPRVYEESARLSTDINTRESSRGIGQFVSLVDFTVQSGGFRLMREWFERGRMLHASTDGLRLLTYEPGVQRTMAFYWDARNDGLWQRQELFYESRALRKIKEFYRGRDDRLWYRSATFEDTSSLGVGYSGARLNAAAAGASPATKCGIRGADEAHRAEPIRMSEKYHRNELIPPDDDVSKYTYVQPAAAAASKAVANRTPPKSGGSNVATPGSTVLTMNAAATASNVAEMWVYFHYRPGSIIRPYRMYPKMDPGEECLIGATPNAMSGTLGALPCTIVMMPNATPPSDMEQFNERNRLRWWVTMCQGRVRTMMTECNSIVESMREPSAVLVPERSEGVIRRLSIEPKGLLDRRVGSISTESDSRVIGGLLPGLRPARRLTLASMRQPRVPAIISVFDTLRNRPLESEEDRQRRLAEEALREEARRDYLAPYIAKLDLPSTFNGDYLNVVLTVDQARRVRDEALRELKERLMHRGRIIQKQMDDEKEELSRRQAAYQNNNDAAVSGMEPTVKVSGGEGNGFLGAHGDAGAIELSGTVTIDTSAANPLGETCGAPVTHSVAPAPAATALTTTGEVVCDAKEFARYCKEATWRMKTLDELLMKHIDRASERYSKLTQRLAEDPRLAVLATSNANLQGDRR